MNNIDIVKLFVHIDDGLKDVEIKNFLERERFRTDNKMGLAEFATLWVAYQDSCFRHMKAFHDHLSRWLKPLFPSLVSYSRFMFWMKEVEKIIGDLLEKHLSPWAGFGMIDASKIPVTNPYRHRPKVHSKTASYGNTAFGRFYGFKIHLLINNDGKIVKWLLTTGSVDDRTPIKDGFLDNITGLILADSGYVSREIHFQLMDANLDLAARPRKNQIEFNQQEWIKRYGHIYKCRQRIESAFNVLKNRLMMVSSRHHHPEMARLYVMSALLTYQLLVQNNF